MPGCLRPFPCFAPGPAPAGLQVDARVEEDEFVRKTRVVEICEMKGAILYVFPGQVLLLQQTLPLAENSITTCALSIVVREQN